MESIKDKPEFCKTVLYKNIYTVMYYKTNKVIDFIVNIKHKNYLDYIKVIFCSNQFEMSSVSEDTFASYC